jgi:hypothetical protein
MEKSEKTEKSNKVMEGKLSKVNVGDVLTRILAGTIPLKVVVGKIDENYVYVTDIDGVIPLEGGWKFLISTGGEVDEELGWDGKLMTGSYIK